VKNQSIPSDFDFAADVPRQQQQAEWLAEHGLYDPADEHAECGVGVVVSVDGKPRREVVTAAIAALQAVWHRGAVDADGKTGDGAGIHLQIPQPFFREHIHASGFDPGQARIAVGMVFLPRTDLSAQERCRVLVEREVLRDGYKVLGWRQVPVRTEVIGEKAGVTRPEIEQILIGNPHGSGSSQFELDLYVIRRRIERAAQDEGIKELYLCSLSCRSLIYKGMFLAEQLTAFYPDLQDPRFISNFAIFHQRYSTNTFPTWSLAQPFRVLAHNGEINTLKSNLNWLQAHEARMASERLGSRIAEVVPVVPPGSSDSSALDAVVELMTRAGRHLPQVKALLMPEAWHADSPMPQALKDMYAYCNAVIEPWDGPAALCGFGGRWVVAGLDRNGLRPLRWSLTRDGLLFAGSEQGMVPLEDERIAVKGQLGPGQMIAVDLQNGRFYRDGEIKEFLAAQQPYGEWIGQVRRLSDVAELPAEQHVILPTDLQPQMVSFGHTREDLELILQPMAEAGKEAIGSMGDDTPLAVLSSADRPLHHFFRQNFAQVTNPPIDPIREKRAMSLRTRMGNLRNILEEIPEQCDLLLLESPLLSHSEHQRLRRHFAETAMDLDCTFAAQSGGESLPQALERIRKQAQEAVAEGKLHLFLSDRRAGPERAPIPMILATGAVHTHLLRCRLRTFVSLNVEAGDAMDVHAIAVILGVGATTASPWLAEALLQQRRVAGRLGQLDEAAAWQNYKQAVDDGLLKILAKLGISVLSSYRGGAQFEALGLSRTLVAEYFPGMPSRVSGIGLQGLQQQVLARHTRAFAQHEAPQVGGFYRWRTGGESHSWEAESIHLLQTAVSTENYATYKKFAERTRQLPPTSLRDLLDFRLDQVKPVPIAEGESITALRKRFLTPGMSMGALSAEAHETLNIAMNRIGARSDSGEGGEDPARFKPKPGGDNANSAIKQVASGRFGVTAEYLNQCKEIEIKVAQGAKPGEGGQLPGFKVTALIARLRHATEGVPLISPPPHHDIYSIEDLAQLIYDLKQINPEAKVCVKLVARSGIGTIAAGVAKAKADIILISGHSGGTGASPLTSVKYAGVPWELGLSEAHQVLCLNRLRHRVKLRVDGGIRTGRDVVIAALLGAEEFGIGTASLVAMGCLMVRQCHSNTCPVGVCTQDEALRQRFAGTPEKVIALFSMIAEEVREILARLGARSLDEIVGRTDLLRQISRGGGHLDDLDLNPILAQADTGGLPARCTQEGRNEVEGPLDLQMLRDAQPLFADGEKMQLQYAVRNTDRAVGTRLSSAITRHFGMSTLQPGHVLVRLRGSAGQSLGAFAVRGLTLEVTGDANDYVGKGLSGAEIVVRPPVDGPGAARRSWEHSIIGNTVLYGATAGTLLAAGRAGERFAVRNSGAHAVVEGCGSNGCEYMTGGTVAILGAVGDNFGAGMSGGLAFIWDPDNRLPGLVNRDTVALRRPDLAAETQLRTLVELHAARTHSRHARQLLDRWSQTCAEAWLVEPKAGLG
jgi:glutamate synthase (NADPH/NADH) large chain